MERRKYFKSNLQGVVIILSGLISSCSGRYAIRLRADTDCPTPGYFRDETDCRKFYRCAEHPTGVPGQNYMVKADFNCPPGTIYDESISSCNHIISVKNLPPGCHLGGTSSISSITSTVAPQKLQPTSTSPLPISSSTTIKPLPSAIHDTQKHKQQRPSESVLDNWQTIPILNRPGGQLQVENSNKNKTMLQQQPQQPNPPSSGNIQQISTPPPKSENQLQNGITQNNNYNMLQKQPQKPKFPLPGKPQISSTAKPPPTLTSPQPPSSSTSTKPPPTSTSTKPPPRSTSAKPPPNSESGLHMNVNHDKNRRPQKQPQIPNPPSPDSLQEISSPELVPVPESQLPIGTNDNKNKSKLQQPGLPSPGNLQQISSSAVLPPSSENQLQMGTNHNNNDHMLQQQLPSDSEVRPVPIMLPSGSQVQINNNNVIQEPADLQNVGSSSVMPAQQQIQESVTITTSGWITPPKFPQQMSPPNSPQQTIPPKFPQQTAPPNFPLQTVPSKFPQQTAPPNFPQQTAPPNSPQQTAPPNFPPQTVPPKFLQQTAPPRFPQQTGSEWMVPDNFPKFYSVISAPILLPALGLPQEKFVLVR